LECGENYRFGFPFVTSQAKPATVRIAPGATVVPRQWHSAVIIRAAAHIDMENFTCNDE
jgi:hypothetical protein